jgi:hypothetical protein
LVGSLLLLSGNQNFKRKLNANRCIEHWINSRTQ